MSNDRQFIECANYYGELLVSFLNNPRTDQFRGLSRGQTGYEQAEVWSTFILPRLIGNANFLLDQGAIGSKQAMQAAVVVTRMLERLTMALGTSPGTARIRQCACGCGKWFVPRTRKQRYHGAGCRNKLWEQKMAESQKERRRSRMKRYMSLYYDTNFKAKPPHA